MTHSQMRYSDWYRQPPLQQFQRFVSVQPGVMDFIETSQPAGHYADPATAQMIVIQTRSAGVLSKGDFGAGTLFGRKFASGQIVVVPPDAPNTVVVDQPHSLRVFCVDTRLLRPAFDQARPNGNPFDLGPLHAGMHDSHFLTAILGRMADEAIRGDALGRLHNESAVVTLGLALLREAGLLTNSSAKGGLAPWQLKRACDAMDAQLDGNIGLEALAAIAGCSPTHFSRAFKQSTGQPPFAWLLMRRIERAKDLLSHTPMPLAEVALAVGFAAQPQFTTAFRRVTGTTPGTWRRENLA